MKEVSIGGLTVSNDLPLLVIAGPCQLESLDHAQMIAGAMIAACAADLVAFGVALFWLNSVELGSRLLAQHEPFIRINAWGALLIAAAVGLAAIRYSKKGSPGTR